MGKRKTTLFVLITVAALVAGGATYRFASASLRNITGTPVRLARPLKSIPLQIMGWQGREVPIPFNIQRVAGGDDFINRLYVSNAGDMSVNLYVIYTARPRTMVGHRPQNCYPANGWVPDSTEHVIITSKQGMKIPCLLHRFHRPKPEEESIIVINFYSVNGILTDDESVFTGLSWRTPNIKGEPARYVVHIQASSAVESAAHRALEDMTDIVLDFLPNDREKKE